MKLITLALLIIMTSICEGQDRAVHSNRIPTVEELDTGSVDMDARFALIIGNSAYEPGRLKNPVNDADSLAEVLKHYGFSITIAKNKGFHELLQEVKTFAEMVKSKRGISLFYFSGHGIQWESRNFLLPLNPVLDFSLGQPPLLELNTILSAITYSRNGFNIVILDACRNNPFVSKSNKQGLTHTLKKTKNTYVFFATSSDDVAEDGNTNNSPFTYALVNTIRENDTIELTKVAQRVTIAVDSITRGKQLPQAVSTVTKDFRFKKKSVNRKPHLFILSIGISDYSDATKLQFSSKGAGDFAAAFYHYSRTFYDSVHVYRLEDQDATRIAILRSISSIRDKAKADDVILMYYNGLLVSDGSAVFLLPVDGKAEMPQITGIEHEQVMNILSRMPCKTMLFLDATASTSLPGGSLSQYIADLTSPKHNVCVLSAASAHEYSYEDTRYNGSLFTYAILNGLEKALSEDNPGFVDVGSLSRYVIDEVPKYSKGLQNPTVSLPSGWNNFVLSKPVAKPDPKSQAPLISPR